MVQWVLVTSYKHSNSKYNSSLDKDSFVVPRLFQDIFSQHDLSYPINSDKEDKQTKEKKEKTEKPAMKTQLQMLDALEILLKYYTVLKVNKMSKDGLDRQLF